MEKKNLLTTAFLAGTALCSLSEAEAQDKPNLILFIADDCSHYDIGCYGSPDSKTPNIDNFAKEGMLFTKAFQACTVSSPTRHNLYTGIWPMKSGAYPNHTFAKAGTKSIVHHLKPEGYKVALIGKSHVEPASVFPWDKYTGLVDGTINYNEVDKFIKECKKNDEPFCLFVASNQPHDPWNKGDASQFNQNELTLPPVYVDIPLTRQRFKEYLGEINYMDDEFGRILKLVDDNGVKDNSVVVYTSEQGNSFPFAKWTCYDAGVHTAFVVRWPGVVEPNSKSDAIVEYVDVVPTFLEMAGAQPVGPLDGESIVPVLKGEKTEHKDYTFSQQTSRGIDAGPAYYAIRSVANKKYRYIWNITPEATFKNYRTTTNLFKLWKAEESAHAQEMTLKYQKRPEIEFYDVENDPYCKDNLAEDPQYAEIMAEMAAALQAWMDECGDKGQETEMEALDHKWVNAPQEPVEVLYVTPEGAGDKDGYSWENAATLAQAATIINSSKTTGQLWLKAGTYNIGESINFDYLHIYGGFNGTETELEQRNWKSNITILDGGDVVSPLRNTVRTTDNSISSIVDGVIIQNGVCPTARGGGGLYVASGAEVRNCIFRNNRTVNNNHGGAIMCYSGDNVIFENSLFINNTALGNGGGIQIGANATASIINCTFANNEAANPGGAIGVGNNETSNATIINTVAYNNLGASEYNSFGQNSSVNGGNKVISINSAIESTSSKFSDGDDTNHITLTRTTEPGFVSPSTKIGRGTTQEEIDEINASSYMLTKQSLCVDGGDDDYATEMTFDLAHNDRIMGRKVDIGAYEFESTASFIPENEIKTTSLSVFVGQNDIYISGAKPGTVLNVFNTSGQSIHSMKIEAEYKDYIIMDLPRRGIYFVVAGDDVVKIRY